MRPDVRVAPGSRIFSPPAKAGVARPGYENLVSRPSAVRAYHREPGLRTKRAPLRRLPGVVGGPDEDGDGAVDLLEEHEAGKPMRPCGRAESNRQLRLLAQAGGEAVVAADDE